MPNLAEFHPQIVHFVVALLFVGVVLRLISLTGRLTFTNAAAATLLLLGTGAAVLAVRSGTDAHGPVERIPGVRDAVIEHEDDATLARNIFLGVAAIELIALALSRAGAARYVRIAHFASAIVGIVGAVQLYEAAEHGGELVYAYAGGPGIRSGNPADVQHLLVAGLYNQSQLDRKNGKHAEAAALIDQLAKQRPGDTTVRLLRVESLVIDSKNYPAAIAAADSISIDPKNARLVARKATLQADAYLALGKPDSARAVLAPVVTAFPQNTRLKAKLDSMK
jgi:uncharacterized membrane protein